jgi:hypothetical protein
MRRALVFGARRSYARTLAFVADRDELGEVLNRRGLVGTGAEVGVREGEFSEQILRRWNGRLLLSIDSWSATDDSEVSQADHDAMFERTRQRLAPFGPRSEIRRRESRAAAAEIPVRSLDFVYIDAAHEYESVAADLAAWLDRVRPGGLLCGHDYYDGFRYGHLYGVRRAVDELCQRRGLRLAVTRLDHPEASWFACTGPTERHEGRSSARSARLPAGGRAGVDS